MDVGPLEVGGRRRRAAAAENNPARPNQHQGLLGVSQDTGCGAALGGSLQGGVDLLLGFLLAGLTTRPMMDTLGAGTRRALPFSLPLRLGSTKATAEAAPVEVGTKFRGTGTGTTQVGVTSVEDHLVSDVEVGGRHGPVLDSEGVAQDLAHGGHTVGGARGVGHHVLGGGVVVALVDSAHVGGAVLARGQ